MADIIGTNRTYRDRLFKFIFGNPDNKEWTLSLYNAVNGSSYTNPDDIKLTTLENAVYMSMKNDVSFLIADTMNFYEQQSTVNPNMPMRFLVYAGMVYSKFVEEDKSYHRYSSKQQKAPTPKCICFYNGVSEQKDKVILKLSDSFSGESDIDVKVTMLNINYGHNKELLDMCKPLNDYAWFVDRVRLYQKNESSLEAAIDRTLNELSDESLIKPFLLANKAEVKYMCITEYDEDRTLAEFREENREELLVELVKKGLLTVKDAAESANMTVSMFEKILASN